MAAIAECLSNVSFSFALLCIEFGVHLAELTVNPQGALAIRQVCWCEDGTCVSDPKVFPIWINSVLAASQLLTVQPFSPCPQLASVILKQYVETHWCSHSEKFRPPETTDQVPNTPPLCSSRRQHPALKFFCASLPTAGQSRHQELTAQRPARIHQQGAIQRRVRRVSHRTLGLARGLAAALHPADGNVG